MGNTGDWTSVVEAQFGSVYNLADSVSQYNEFDDNKKWLYFIALSIFGVKKNAYLQHAVFNSANYCEFPKSLFRAILTMEHTDAEFGKLYAERKDILKNILIKNKIDRRTNHPSAYKRKIRWNRTPKF